MPRPSAVASRFAAYWVADALAGDEVLDFSVTKALVARKPDSLTGAPAAVREHVALRCLQEVVSIASEGEGEAAAAPGMLGVDASRSCEDVLLQLIGEVGRPGSLEKGILPHFNQDIQKFICVKGPTLPVTSFELLRDVHLENTRLSSLSMMEQNENNKHDNFESFSNTSHDLVNKEKAGFATDGAQLPRDGLANSVNDGKTGNLQKDAMASTPGFQQLCTSDNSFFDQAQGDNAIDAVRVNIRSPKDGATNVDKHTSVSAEPSLATCKNMLGSNSGSMSERDKTYHNTMVQPQSCGIKNPNTLHNNDGNESVLTSIQSFKDCIHEGWAMQATISPAFNRSKALLPVTSETSHMPESITVEDRVMTSDLRITITHLNSQQHDESNQEIDYGSVGSPLVGRNSDHEQPILQTAAALPSEGCNGVIQSQSWGVNNPNTLHKNDGNEPLVNFTGVQSSKVSVHEGSSMQTVVSPAFDRSNDALLASTCKTSHFPEFITVEDTVMTSEPNLSRAHPNSPQHDKVNQDVDYGSASMPSLIKNSGHDERTLQTAATLSSEGCDGAIQGHRSEIKNPPENATKHTKMFEQHNSGNVHLEAAGSDKANQGLYDDGNTMKRNTVCGELDVQTTLKSCSFSMVLPNKIAEPNHLSEQNIEKNTIGVQKDRGNIQNSYQGVNDKRDKKASHQKTMGDTVVETSDMHSSDDSLSGLAAAVLLSMTAKITVCTQDNDANGSLEGLSQQDLCIKCGKDGQLLKCSSCLLAAHDSCFGSSLTFDDSSQFYCPVCFYTKATQAYQKAKITYSEARKNLSIFLGRRQLVEQREQPAAVRQKATNCEGNLNGCTASKRQDNHQYLADEQPVWQRKRQKSDATGDACPQKVAIEKEPVVQNRDVVPMNKCSVLQNNRNRAPVAEHEQPEENAEPHGEFCNDNSSCKQRHSYQTKHNPAGNRNVDSDKEDDLTASHLSEDSDEIEATSSNHSSKQSSPPWRNMRNSKARCQDNDTAIICNSKKLLGIPDQHMASPSRKRNYAYPPKRYCNPVAPNGRRTKLCWTEQEEAALRVITPRL
uniref:Zinc finger PHD-type domain-containing protein n=1 Tax=Leersia perrieri TaxID=77586 RepID=A0A0D9VGC0_9ORYZ